MSYCGKAIKVNNGPNFGGGVRTTGEKLIPTPSNPITASSFAKHIP